MCRAVLNTYLVAVLLAGPSLCCCTTARMLSMLTSERPSEDHAQSGGCRCNHHQVAHHEHGAPKKHEHKPCDDGPCCGKTHWSMPVALQCDVDLTAEIADSGFLLACCPVNLQAVACLGGNAGCGWDSSRLAHLDSKGILRALQVMRC